VAVSDELREDEGIVYADIDLTDCIEPKQFHDISGGYNRFDIFQLTVNRDSQRPVRFTEDTGSQTHPIEERETDSDA
jgi:aliphatic nitrilase